MMYVVVSVASKHLKLSESYKCSGIATLLYMLIPLLNLTAFWNILYYLFINQST